MRTRTPPTGRGRCGHQPRRARRSDGTKRPKHPFILPNLTLPPTTAGSLHFTQTHTCAQTHTVYIDVDTAPFVYFLVVVGEVSCCRTSSHTSFITFVFPPSFIHPSGFIVCVCVCVCECVRVWLNGFLLQALFIFC